MNGCLSQDQGCVPGTDFAAKEPSLEYLERLPIPVLRNRVQKASLLDAAAGCVPLDTTSTPNGIPRAPDAGRDGLYRSAT